MPASAHNLIAIKVTGSKRFTPDEVIAASGLRLNITATDEDFKRAARILGDTGAFGDIAYKFSYSSAGTTLELQITDADKFLPAHFEDFVWFTDDDLRRTIKDHIPLFNGQVPASGRMTDEVSDVLQGMLVRENVPGHVNYMRHEGPDGQIDSINYSVSDVLIRVRNVEFVGAGAKELPLLEAAAQRLPDRVYSRSRLAEFVEYQLLPVYYARGYLKASFSPPQPKVVKQSAAESSEATQTQTLVDVMLTVNPGQQYKLTRVDWSGNHDISTDTLQGMLHVQPNQPVNRVRLADDLNEVEKLYGSRGYVNARIKVEPQFDEAAGTVAFLLEVKEDYVYHMGVLEFRGLDNSLIAKLRAAWNLRPGDVYDATYVNRYIPEANKLLPAALDWGVAVHVTANVRDKTVDVDLQYTARAPR
jgi:outer membrane protein insertion porin family